MFASVPSAAVTGIGGHPINVEVHVSDGLPGFTMIGLPDTIVRESRDRARAALLSIGGRWPNGRVTVSLVPTHDRKSGSALDVALALGVLVAAEELAPESLDGLAFLGELGLDGSIRSVPGAAPMVGALGERDVVVPVGNLAEAHIAALGTVRPVGNLRELVEALAGIAPWPDYDPPAFDSAPEAAPDLADVQGQPLARLAIEIAAAGGHHTLFVGPPGSGKTMLASRLQGLLPVLTREQALEVTMIHSAAGLKLPSTGLVLRPPIRSPHHTSSRAAMVGGGTSALRPGEISNAHCGVLFLDELAEFPASVLEGLREPLEDGMVQVSRAEIKADIPAEFVLVAAMNPCPCGGGPPGRCQCGAAQLKRYATRVSGPILDRFDLRVAVHRPRVDELIDGAKGESTATVAARVLDARDLAFARQGSLNRSLEPDVLDEFAPIDPAGRALLRREMESDRLSARGYHRLRRVARTIADLRQPGVLAVDEAHVAMALRLRDDLAVNRRMGWVA